MAATGGSPDPHVSLAEVKRLLREDPCSFRFFQAVRLLELMDRDRSPVGRFSPPDREVVRFRTHNALAFPASEIQSIQWADGGPPEISVNFMGLTGPSGILPLCYTELVIERVRARDRTLEAFLDIFHHRMISLFFQAWQKHRYELVLDPDRQNKFDLHIAALIGLGTPGLQRRQEIDDLDLLFYAGLLSLQPRSAAALRDILCDYFAVPAEIEQFVGSWYSLDEPDQCRMEETESASLRLGEGAVVGDAIWDQQSRLRVRLGPMTRRRYLQFLPNGSAHRSLRALLRFFSNDTLDFEVQLVLQREQVPLCRLGTEGEEAPRLGWLTWMKSAPGFSRDPDDTILVFQ